MSRADDMLREACARIAREETEALLQEMDLSSARQAEALYQRHQKSVVELLNRQMRRGSGLKRFLQIAACAAVILGAAALIFLRDAPDPEQPLTPGLASFQPYYTGTPAPEETGTPAVTPTITPSPDPALAETPPVFPTDFPASTERATSVPAETPVRPSATPASLPFPRTVRPESSPTAASLTPVPTSTAAPARTPPPTGAVSQPTRTPKAENTPYYYPWPADQSTAAGMTFPPPATPTPTPILPPSLQTASPVPEFTAAPDAAAAFQGYPGWTGAYVNFPGYLPQGCAVRRVEREEDCTHSLLGPAEQPDAIQFDEYASARTLAAAGQPLQVAYVRLTGPALADGTAQSILALQETYPDGAVSLTWDQDGRTYRLAAQAAYAEEIFTMASRLEKVQNKTYLGEE